MGRLLDFKMLTPRDVLSDAQLEICRRALAINELDDIYRLGTEILRRALEYLETGSIRPNEKYGTLAVYMFNYSHAPMYKVGSAERAYPGM
jgi:hypothetical protein